jgi:hypothetical protein
MLSIAPNIPEAVTMVATFAISWYVSLLYKLLLLLLLFVVSIIDCWYLLVFVVVGYCNWLCIDCWLVVIVVGCCWLLLIVGWVLQLLVITCKCN